MLELGGVQLFGSSLQLYYHSSQQFQYLMHCHIHLMKKHLLYKSLDRRGSLKSVINVVVRVKTNRVKLLVLMLIEVILMLQPQPQQSTTIRRLKGISLIHVIANSGVYCIPRCTIVWLCMYYIIWLLVRWFHSNINPLSNTLLVDDIL